MLAVAGCGGSHGKASVDPQRNAVRIVATEAVVPKGDYTLYRTERGLHPPEVSVQMGPADGTSPEQIFLTPRAPDPKKASGPTILDARGRLQWFLTRPGRVTSDLEPQTFKGKPVLTWGERDPVTTPDEIFRADPKKLYFVMVDNGYKEILKLRAIGAGVGTDMHEMLITKRGTALIIGYKIVTRDLTSVGGNPDVETVDGIVQEIDLNTGKLLLNWSALQHVPMSESMFP